MKYHSRKCVSDDGQEFDSIAERRRYYFLRARLAAGEIRDLRRQVEYVLIEPKREADTVGARGGIKKGKIIEHGVSYFADFVYIDDGQTVVEDVKSKATKTDAYIIKRKLMLDRYGLRIREVE